MPKIGHSPKLTWWRADLIVATLLYNLVLGAGLFVGVQILTDLTPSSTHDTLIYGSGLLVTVFISSSIFLSRQKILNWLVRQNFYHAALTLFSQQTTQSITILRQIPPPSDSRSLLLNSLFADLIRTPLALILLALISTSLAAILSVLTLILLAISLYQGSKILEAHKNHRTQNSQTDIIQQECLKNYQTIKLMAMENLMLRRYEKSSYGKAYSINTASLLGLTSQDIYSTWQTVCLVSVTLVLGNEYAAHNLALDQLIACLLLVGFALTPVQALLSHWDDLMRYRLSMQQLVHATEDTAQTNTPIDLDGALKVETLEYTYPGSQTPILTGTNLTISPKTLVTIYGQSGSGKTTLAKLILRSLTPDQGKIKFGDIDSTDIPLTSFRQQVMYLSSDPQLYVGTILENLTFFKIGPLVDEALKLSQQLGLDTWVQNQPLGYQTPIFDSLDTTIPSGIKQRIGLVRAFLQEPKILILDEANSYLDDPGDKALKSVLLEMKEGMTIIFITHRPSLKNIADDSYDLVHGQLLPSLNVDAKKPSPYSSALMSVLAGDA
jgi:ATP-binding cassette subfamily C protein LapB